MSVEVGGKLRLRMGRLRARQTFLCRVAASWSLLVALGVSDVASGGSKSSPDKTELRRATRLRLEVNRLHDLGRFGAAIPIAKRECSLLERELGAESDGLAKCLGVLADLYKHERAYVDAVSIYERASAILERKLGPRHLETAAILFELADAHFGRYADADAESLHRRVLSIREEALGPSHLLVGKSLNGLALPLIAQGKYVEAEPLLQRALSIYEKELDPSHPRIASVLRNLGEVHKEQGKYGEAEPLFLRALSINEKALGPNHPDVARVLVDLSSLFMILEASENAERLSRRALRIVEDAWGPNDPRIANYLTNVALACQWRNAYAESTILLERALLITEKAQGPDHPSIVNKLCNLAAFLRHNGSHEKAERMFRRALSIGERTLGPDHPKMANILSGLGDTLLERGAHEDARVMKERSLLVRERALGPNHPTVAASLGGLAALRQRQGDHDAALMLLRRKLDIEERNLLNLYIVDDPRRLSYMSQFLGYDMISLHLQAAPDHHETAELALTALLRRKGRTQELMAQSLSVLRESLQTEHRYLLDELSAVQARYSALVYSGERLRPDGIVGEIVKLQRTQDQLWNQLSEASPVVRAVTNPVKVQDVQEAIPEDAVLVEIVAYHPGYGPPSPPRYAAYLVFADHIDWVDLGPADSIDRYVEGLRRALQLKQPIPTDLHDAVMQPITERLGDARRLFIVPDGDLNLVPFGALYDGRHYLIEKYTLHYLSTGRDLLRSWEPARTHDDTVVVVANPTGANLPGAEVEAKLLESLFPHVHIVLHDAATETGLQRRTQPWIAHIAAHGFFSVPGTDPKLQAEMVELMTSMPLSEMPFSPVRLDNPMLHSGLLLASSVDENTADSRLTAYEISGWDLRGTELVVLSACGTGLGELRAGEGVLGLRRAFAMAGAQTQVMSLWDVPDSTTARLMEAYYRKLLDGKGRAEAMQEVQLEMLRSEEHHLPGDWASFVVVGEWRPLSAEKLPELEGPPLLEPRGCGCQRASIGGDHQPSGVLVLGLLGLLTAQRRSGRWSRSSADRWS